MRDPNNPLTVINTERKSRSTVASPSTAVGSMSSVPHSGGSDSTARNRIARQYGEIISHITDSMNYLTNSTFHNDVEGWNLSSLADGGELPRRKTYEGKLLMNINNAVISQSNSYVVKPTVYRMFNEESGSVNQDVSLTEEGVLDSDYISIQTGADEHPHKSYLTFRFYCTKAGTLHIGFDGSTGDMAVQSFTVTESKELQEVAINGVWDSTGDFTVSFTGELYVEKLFLSGNPLKDHEEDEFRSLWVQLKQNLQLIKSAIDGNRQLALTVREEISESILSLESISETVTGHTGLIETLTEKVASLEERIEELEAAVNG